MAHQRGGAKRRRCLRDGLFVDGVKVPVGPGGAAVLWRDGSRVRQVTPASWHRIMGGRSGPLEVLVVAHGATVHPDWFDALPPGLAVWRGRLDADASGARARRRVRQIAFWDDRNLLSCVQFISDHPDPAVPEHRLLAQAALAAAEAGQVAFVRRRANLEALVRAGERSSYVREDLAVVRTLLHGTPEHPLDPTDDRKVLRRRATRLLNRSEAVTARLQAAAALDRSGAALTVASRVAAVDERKALEAAAATVASAAAAAAVYLVSTPEAGLWAYRALATLSVFARANARTIERSGAGGPERAGRRQQRWEQDHALLSRSAPDALLADAAMFGVQSARDGEGTAAARAADAALGAGQHLYDSAHTAALATADLARDRKMGAMLVNLAGSVSVVALHAKAAQLVSVLEPDLSAAGVELASAALLGTSSALLGRSRSPGVRLAREARSVRKDFARSRRSVALREAAAYALLPEEPPAGRPAPVAAEAPLSRSSDAREGSRVPA